MKHKHLDGDDLELEEGRHNMHRNKQYLHMLMVDSQKMRIHIGNNHDLHYLAHNAEQKHNYWKVDNL